MEDALQKHPPNQPATSRQKSQRPPLNLQQKTVHRKISPSKK